MNKLTLILVLALGLVAMNGDGVSAAEPTPVPGRILVSFEPGVQISIDKSAGVPRTGLANLDAVLDNHGTVSLEPLFGDMIRSFDDPATRADLARHYILHFEGKAGNDAMNADLKALPIVQDSDSDMVFKQAGTAYMPNDLAGPQWHLRNITIGGGDTRAIGGWAETLGDTSVVVAVLDSGVDWHHPDLGGAHPDKVNGSIWTNWTEYYGTPGSDDDGNGYVDDIRGWDYVNVSEHQVWPGEDYGPPDNDPMDFGGHGTLVSGCIAPITDNGIGIAAMVPGSKIMAIRIGWYSSDGNGYSNASLMAQGFVYATANGADIINLSYGTGYSTPFASAIQAALNAGLVICVAAGNDNEDNPGYLQGLTDDRILTVAASNSGDGKSDFSNYGAWIDVTAPGSNIYTTVYNFPTDESTYGSTQGTSFACPIAAGGCALIWSAYPEFSSAQVAELIQSSCDDIDHLNPGYEGELGSGRINMLKALGDNIQQVPQEFLDIQDALNMAAIGDILKVLGSLELPTVTMQGKSLQVLGGYNAGYITRDPVNNKTLISGNPNDPALQFYGDVDQTCVFDGFEVTNGGGRFYADIPYPGRYGGGIMINGNSPTMRNVEVSGNSVGAFNELGLGGGITLSNSEAVLEDITVTGNTAIYGAGVYIYQSDVTLTNVTIDGNTVITDNLDSDPRGGGMHIIDSDVVLNNVTLNNHQDVNLGGGLYAAILNGTSNIELNDCLVSNNSSKTAGSGLGIYGGTFTAYDSEIVDNGFSAAATFQSGGGIYATATNVTLDGVTIDNNAAHAAGAGEFASCPTVMMTNTVITNNSGQFFSGSVYLNASVEATVQNVTFAQNSCPAGGAGLYSISTPLTVSNTISAFNTGGTGIANGMYIVGTPVLECNDVFGNDGAGYGGIDDPTGTAGNIAADPLFCDVAEGDFRVSPAGPCAPEQSGGCGLIGALEADCGTVNGVEDSAIPMVFRVDPNYPNPFNPITNIRFAIPEGGHTSVVIFDVKGRKVRTLVDAQLPAATHSVQWRGQDDRGRNAAAGIYFYRVTSGDHSAVGRMALIK